MKTAHQFAGELLMGPDLPVFHFDPSRAGMDDEVDTSLAVPVVEVVKACRKAFITIVGDGELRDEPGAFAERVIDCLVSSNCISGKQLERAREYVRRTDAAEEAGLAEQKAKGVKPKTPYSIEHAHKRAAALGAESVTSHQPNPYAWHTQCWVSFEMGRKKMIEANKVEEVK